MTPKYTKDNEGRTIMHPLDADDPQTAQFMPERLDEPRRMNAVVWVILAALIFVASAIAAVAQPVCRPVEAMHQGISGQDGYAESLTWQGLDARGVISELWVNERTGTWTIVVVDADGIACIAGYGDAGQMVQAKGDPA